MNRDINDMKLIKIISAFTAAMMLSSCALNRDDIDMPIQEYTAPTEGITAENTENVPAFGGSVEYSDYEDYFDDTDISDDAESPNETSSETVMENEDTENPTEPPQTEETQSTVTTEKKSKKKKTPDPDHEKAECIKVPYISQESYPTGCELVSTSMLLAHYGFEIEPYQLIEKGYIKSVEVEWRDEKLYGGDPNKVYVGDPRKSTGYGCYSGAVKKCLEKYLEDEFFDVYNLTDMSLDDICEQYIDFGQPVMIWASIGMMPLEQREDSKWTIKDTDEEFTWLSNEHCMVLVGYDDNYYYVHDPLKQAYTAYKRSEVEKRYKEMGSQAVTIISW